MKLLLTSAGITNRSIRTALVELLGKPIEDSTALLIATAVHPLPGGRRMAWQFLAGQEPQTPMAELGWASIGVLELTALPSLPRSVWVPDVEEADVLLVGGGDTIYLDRWMRESGLADLLPSLDLVYVGFSAGSVVVTPSVDDVFALWTPPAGDEGLGLVDVGIFPHLDHPELPAHDMAHAERWASRQIRPGYAIDDQTAIKVVDGVPEVVSEGQWRRFDAVAPLR